MKLQSILSSAIMAGIFLGGAVDIEAMRIAQGINLGGADGITPIKADGSPVLIGGSNEELLFKALQRKGIHLLTMEDVVVSDVQDLKKYLQRLISKGINENYVNNTKATKIRTAVHNAIANKIAGKYHKDARKKAEHVRLAVDSATTCLTAITDATRAIALAGNLDDIRNAFTQAMNTINASLTDYAGGGGLAQIISSHFAENQAPDRAGGKSGQSLEAQRQAILNLRTALIALLNLAINRINAINAINALHGNSSATMKLFHEMYVLFCSQHLGGDMFFNDFDEYDPASPENGNKNFQTRYREWAAANGEAVPNNGDPLI
jgi:hypothetical protein